MTLKAFTISAALALVASSASAQTNGWLAGASQYSDTDYRAPYADARRAAYDNGYRDGLKRGEQAARDRRALDVERERDYRDAQGGYNSSYGDKTRYKNDYRGGFAQGYRDAYYRADGSYTGNGAYDDRAVPRGQGVYNGQGGVYRGGDVRTNRGYGYGNAAYGAYQNGASDGYRKGLEDVQDRNYPDPARHKWYRSGDHDYDKAYGSKDAYKQEYRRGFQEGYNRAVREGRRY